jgi:Tfp pilus assembly protein PilV
MSDLPDLPDPPDPPDLPDPRDRGCTLIEVLVATTCLVVALAFVAQVYALAAQTTRRAAAITRATILAQDKMEDLVSRAAGDGALAASPAGALAADIEGCFDVVNGSVRRWSIEPLPDAQSSALVIQVVVRHSAATAASSVWDAHLVTVRRKVS